MRRLLDYLPHGALVDDVSWGRRHHFLLWVLASQGPVLALLGFFVRDNPVAVVVVAAVVPLLTAVGGYLAPGRRSGSLFVAAGLTASCMGWVILSHGSIEAHFSFFVIIGFLTLYQHWVPFVWNIVFTTISHGLGSALVPTLIFNHPDAQQNPWLWSVIHGVAVLLACIGVMIFCRTTEDEQARRATLTKQLSDAEIRQQEFTSELLLNLARRNQSMFHRQLDIINDLEERERDPDALAELFRLDHLATRVRRNAESLLVLSGEQPARTWSAPVPLRDVVRAGVAETEDLDRVSLHVEEQPRVVGGTVADLTHVVAELVENAVRFSSPTSAVNVQSRPYQRVPGAHLVIVEDTGVGMPASDLAAANALLASPQDVDVSASRRLGFHVVSRLAERHGIEVSLTPTPGCGVTAVIVLPPGRFAEPLDDVTTDERPAIPGQLTDTAAFAVPAGHANGNGRTDGSHRDAGVLGRVGGPGTVTADRPAGSPPRFDGRHSWPGREDARPESERVSESEPDPEPAEPRAATDVDGATVHRGAREARQVAERGVSRTHDHGEGHDEDELEPHQARTGSHRAVAPDDRPGRRPDPGPDDRGSVGAANVRRRLIHPMVVPPPAADDVEPNDGPASAGGPDDGGAPAWAGGASDRAGALSASRLSERDATALAPAPRRPVDAENGSDGLPPLKRRVPQTHLAPELIRPRGAPASPAVSTPAVSSPPTPRPDAGSTPPGAVSGGPLDALSRYQASREAAQSTIAGGTATDGAAADRRTGHVASDSPSDRDGGRS